jgi:O-antigen/teichoic acid export membrane protein
MGTPRIDLELTESATAVLVGSGVALASSLLVRVIMARTLASDELGALLFAIAVVSVGGGISTMGLRPASARRIAGCLATDDSVVAADASRTALVTGFFTGLFGTLVVVVAASLSTGERFSAGEPLLLTLLAPVCVSLAVGMSVLGISQGHHDTRGRALFRDAGGGTLRLLCVVVAAVVWGGLLQIGLGWMIGCVLGEGVFLVYGLCSGWFRGGSRRLDWPLVRSLPPFAGMTFLNQTRTWLDVLLLGMIAPLSTVGIYGVARSLGRVLAMVQASAAHRYLPLATAAEAQGDTVELADAYRHARSVTFSFVWIPLAVCLFCPGELIVTVFGINYAGAAPALRLLAAGFIAPALLGYTDETLVAKLRSGTALRLGLVGAVASAVVMVLAVPSIGAAGAALAVAVGLTLRSLAGFALIGRALQRALWTAQSTRRLVLAALPALVVAVGLTIWEPSAVVRIAAIVIAAAPSALTQAIGILRRWL